MPMMSNDCDVSETNNATVTSSSTCWEDRVKLKLHPQVSFTRTSTREILSAASSVSSSEFRLASENSQRIAITARSDCTANSFSNIPWQVHRKYHRMSPLKFKVRVDGQIMTVVYDSQLTRSIGNVAFLRKLRVNADIVENDKIQFVRIPSSRNIYELSNKKIDVPFKVGLLKFDLSIYCVTTFHLNGLFLGRDFGEKYLKTINPKTSLLTLSNGVTKIEVPYHPLRCKSRDT